MFYLFRFTIKVKENIRIFENKMYDIKNRIQRFFKTLAIIHLKVFARMIISDKYIACYAYLNRI